MAYVVGDQYSFFRIPIKTGEIITNIAENLGYKYVKTDLFRTRMATKTKQAVNENVVILEKDK